MNEEYLERVRAKASISIETVIKGTGTAKMSFGGGTTGTTTKRIVRKIDSREMEEKDSRETGPGLKTKETVIVTEATTIEVSTPSDESAAIPGRKTTRVIQPRG